MDKEKKLSSILARVPVPTYACKQAIKALKTVETRVDNIVDLGFAVISHLLANGGEHFITKEGFIALGAPKNSVSRAKCIEYLRQKGLIEVSQGPRWDGANPSATYYRIPDDFMARMLEDANGRTFKTLAKYKNRESCKVAPFERVDSSFDELGEEEWPFKEAVFRLQQRGLFFDLAGFKGNCAKIVNLADAKQRRQIAYALFLQDGVNYTAYRLARSGRVQAMHPNLQGIPKALRRWFYPPEGYNFLDFDFKTQESYIIAYLSQDQKLKAALGGDIYRIIANQFHLARDTQVKPMFNAFNYGAGQLTLARSAFGLENNERVSVEQLQLAKQFVEFMKAEFPVMQEWKQKKIQEIRRQGCARTVGGFERCDFGKSEASTKGLNHVIQGTGADILREILCLLNRELDPFGAFVALPMHDGLLVVTPKEQADAVETVVRRAMADAVNKFLPGIEIPVEMASGWKAKDEKTEECNLRPGVMAALRKPA